MNGLNAIRCKRKLTQAALAARAGFSREYVARLETGRHDPPLSTVLRLAKALDVPVAKLIGGRN